MKMFADKEKNRGQAVKGLIPFNGNRMKSKPAVSPVTGLDRLYNNRQTVRDCPAT
ncbi:MAG: hypothetical protein GY950_00225 [bacterium]|nr:hypothetical protein [bacterium]